MCSQLLFQRSDKFGKVGWAARLIEEESYSPPFELAIIIQLFLQRPSFYSRLSKMNICFSTPFSFIFIKQRRKLMTDGTLYPNSQALCVRRVLTKLKRMGILHYKSLSLFYYIHKS